MNYIFRMKNIFRVLNNFSQKQFSVIYFDSKFKKVSYTLKSYSQAINENNLKTCLWILLKYSLIGFTVTKTFTDCVGYVAVVNGKSMQPELNPDPEDPCHYNPKGNSPDWVLVNTWKIRNYEFRRGEIVILVSPKDPYDYLIKRIIALEGDLVTSPKFHTIKIPQGQAWVEGDNMEYSLDSNNYGPVPLGLFCGKATHIIWPPSRWRSLGKMSFNENDTFSQHITSSKKKLIDQDSFSVKLIGS